MKTVIKFSLIAMLAILCTSCGGSKDKNSDSNEAEKKEITIDANLLGIGKYWYNEKGRNVYRVSLKIYTDNPFNGEILFKLNGDDSLAKGILITDRERTNFNYDVLFKKVKLSLEPASDTTLKNTYFVTKLELIESKPYNELVAGNVIVDSTDKLKWLPVGEELHPNTKDFAVVKTCVFKDTLYTFSGIYTAGVGFSLGYLGADYLKGIKKLSGSKWENEGLNLRGVVYSTLINKDELYVGGKFTAIGGSNIYGIAKYNNSQWSSIGSGSPIGNEAKVLSMVEYKGEIYAGGEINYPYGDDFATGIAKWNGTKWGAVGIGKKSDYNNNLSNGLPGFVRALIVYKNELYAGGNFVTADGKFVYGIAKWNGSEWSNVGLGVDGSVWSFAILNDELYVGGKFKSVGGTPAQSLAKWDGKDWTVISSPILISDDGVIRTMLVQNNWLYLGGKFMFQNETFDVSNIVKFDGKKFYTVGMPEKLTESSDKLIYGFSGGINGLTTYRDELYANGEFTMLRDKNIIKGITKLSDKK